MRKWIGVAAAVVGMLATGTGSAQEAVGVAPLTVSGGQFLLKGKPFRVISGELEYARIPREDWRDRLKKVHGLGLNTVTVYVFWNLHETKPGVYDFTGQNDVAEFIREAQQEGLYVILRPGPYVCAEWDLGGYPAWLLKDHAMVLRSSQAAYMEAATRWMMRLGKELAPLQAANGGPIVMVQVENEYGSFGKDKAYLQQMYQLVQKAGFTGSLLYTGDGADVLADGTLPGVMAGIDFGTGDAARSVALEKKFRPEAPVYVAEYWDGWFDHWGAKHELTDGAKQVAEIKSMLEEGDSISMYMTLGGTSWGWMNGANSDHDGYQPDVNSYDYDAPLDESGRPRPKYFELRKVIADVTHTEPVAVPESAAMIALPAIELKESRSLWSVVAKAPGKVTSAEPLSMEDIGQAYGYIVYSTTIKGDGTEGELAFDALHSYARVYVDGKFVGVVDRRLGQQTLKMTLPSGKHRLDLLVENSGRINFTQAIRGERAGITHSVSYKGAALEGFKIVPLPLNAPPSDGYSEKACEGACLYRAAFDVAAPGDTFLDTTKLGKGVVWVNGHLLGRFWNVGPMGSLYLPGAWLHQGENAITVFDLDGGADVKVRGNVEPHYLDPK